MKSLFAWIRRLFKRPKPGETKRPVEVKHPQPTQTTPDTPPAADPSIAGDNVERQHDGVATRTDPYITSPTTKGKNTSGTDNKPTDTSPTKFEISSNSKPKHPPNNDNNTPEPKSTIKETESEQTYTNDKANSKTSDDEGSTSKTATPTGGETLSNIRQGNDRGGSKKPTQSPGKRNNTTGRTSENPPRPQPNAKPELICLAQEWPIAIVLSMPTNYKLNNILQNGSPLTYKDNKYIIENLSDPIIIQTADNVEERIPLAGDKYLIFKTRKEWNGDGRQISYFTKGFFIVITPSSWSREGQPPIEPHPCSDNNYTAHFFEVNPTDNSNSHFFKECKTPPQRQKIYLDGTTIPDDSEHGSLFVQQIPQLRREAEIVWVRVGEEGTDPKAWEHNFRIAEDSLASVLESRCGRFYIRVYDEDVKLIDSEEFRYCSDLSKIQIDGNPYDPEILLPPLQQGYEPSRLEFLRKDGQHLSSYKKSGVANESEKSPKAIELFPDDNKTTWIIETEQGEGKVEVVINLPRIWWRLEPSDKVEWRDKSLHYTREHFRYQAQIDTKIMFEAPSYIKKINVGFDNELDRTIPIKEGIPFTAFVNYHQIAEPQSQPSYLQIGWEDTVITVLTILPDKPNKPLSILRPLVKSSNGKTRQGKGFSKGEIESVDMSTQEGRRLAIYIDHRRRTVHSINTELLKGYINANDK